jgi:enterochelin esterase family protein
VNNPGFAAFVAEELVPAVDAAYRTRPDRDSRAVLGTSLGGVFSAYLGVKHPGVFGRLAIHSPAFWISESGGWGAGPSIYTLMEQAAPGAFRVAMTTGTINDTEDEARRMRDILTARGHALTYREVPEGHSWGNWRALIDDVLVPLFPPAPTAGEAGPETGGLRFDAVPNPGRAAGMVLRYTLDTPARVGFSCYDSTGRAVATMADVGAAAGTHEQPVGGWNLATGVYACRMTAGDARATRTLTVLP